MPLVSVITTCFLAGESIEKTIKSVLAQSFRDFEYIIMDGGSTDDTLQRAEAYKNDFDKAGIPYRIFSKKDHGIYEGMNHGIAHAEGVFVNFMNADDSFYDEHVLSDIFGDINSPKMDNRNADVLYGDAVAIEFGQAYPYVKDLTIIERRMPFSHQSVFARRELLLAHPFNIDLKIGADYDFLLTVYQEGRQFVDTGIKVCTVTLDGVSSVDLLHTFEETVAIQRAHGINRFSDTAYRKAIRKYHIKQFVMDHFPKGIIASIRKLQRIMRGQNEHC